MESDDNLLLQKLCDAANRNNAAQVGLLLGCRKIQSPSINEPLLCCSKLVERLQDRLLSVDADDSTSENSQQSQFPENTSLDNAVKALLIGPSIYETPWKTACEFIKYVHRNDVRMRENNLSFMRLTVADIQNFFLQAVATWWEEERKQTASNTRHRRRSVRPIEGERLSERNPRYWILKLVSIVMEPLLVSQADDGGGAADGSPASVGAHASSNPNMNEHWTVPLDLISTIISVSNDLETSLLYAVLDLVFRKGRVRSDRILPWVNAASELRLFLRDKDWTAVHVSLKQALTMQPCPVHRQDLPGLAEVILSLCTTTTARVDEGSPFTPCWQELILQLLSVAASTDLAMFSTVETILESSLASLPSRALQQWTAAIATSSVASASVKVAPQESFKMKWIEANMLLLILRASQQSGSQLVSRLVALAFGGSKGVGTSTHKAGEDLRSVCWKRLVLLASLNDLAATTGASRGLGISEGISKQRRSVRISKVLRRVFDGVAYAGQGRFENRAGDQTSTALTGMSSLLFHSLFLDCEESLQSSHLLHVMERAQAWVHCANAALQSSRGPVEATELVAAVVIFITIYCEIPMARSSLARDMLQGFSSDADLGVDIACLATVHSLVISGVLSSSPKDTSSSNAFSSELERLSDIFSQPVPLSVFCDLAWALSPLSSARRALLAIAQKQLDGVIQVHCWSAMEVASRGINDSFERIKCGLSSLLILMSASVWDDCKIEAWSLLSDVIVENRPTLSLPARSWLFRQLKESQHFHGRAAKHLLRACLARLMYYIGPDKNGRESFAYEKAFASWGNGLTKQIEDIAGLFDLVFTLLHRDDYDDSIIEKQRLALSSCRDLLPRLIEIERSVTNQPSPAADDIGCLHPSMPLLVVDCSFPCYVAFYCLMLALQEATTLGRLVFDGKTLPAYDDIKTLLVKQEREELRVSSMSQSPTWLEPKNQFVGTLAGRKQSFDKTQSIPIRLALYDAVIELFLCQIQLPSSRGNAMDDDHLDKESGVLSIQLTAVFGRKRQLADQLRGANEINAVVLPYSPDKLMGAFEGFCTVVVPVLKQSISDRGDFSNTNAMLSATMDVCELVTNAVQPCRDDEGCSMRRRLVCLWDLYTSLCEEKAAVQLIGYLESQRDTGETKQIWRMPIDGPDDIDCVVRRVRISVARRVSAGFADYLLLNGSESFEREMKKWGPASPDVPPEFFIRFIDCVTGDLRAGLEGASGGLTYDLFLSMIECIENCAKVLLDMLPSAGTVNTAMVASLVEVCHASSKSLEGILCNFALQQAAAFKKTLMLCVGTLPAVARCARSQISPSGRTYQNKTYSAATRIFDQLTFILKRKNDHSSVLDMPWELVVGNDHLGANNDLNDDDFSLLSGGSTDLLERQETLPRNVGPGGSEKEMISLQTERAWTWSLCCVLQAFEDNWEESQRLVQYSQDEIGPEVELSAYYAIRTNEFAETLRSTCILFQRTTRPTKVNATKGSDMTVYAVTLPVAAKTKLCFAIERVLFVLQKSMKRIMSQFRGQSNSLVTDNSCRSLAEAISCLVAWLSSLTKGAELSSGVQRWHMVEKQLARLPRRDSVAYAAEALVVRRLPKLVFRLGDLDLTLQKLSQMIQGYTSVAKKSERSSLLNKIDSLVEQSGTEPTGSAFSKLLSDKLTYLEQEQLQLECDFCLSSAEDDKASGKKRKIGVDIGRRVQRERRRRIVRSRNGVVDTWLQMDRKTGVDEAMHDDAYADLEDFLVDG